MKKVGFLINDSKTQYMIASANKLPISVDHKTSKRVTTFKYLGNRD